MSKYDGILFQIWMRILLGAIFLISILFKLGLELDYLTTQVVAGENAKWMTAPWIVRGLLTGEIIIFLLLIFLKYGRKFRTFYLLIVVMLSLQHTLLYLGLFKGDYGLLSYCSISLESGGFVATPSYLISLIAAITFVALGYFATRIKKNYQQLKWYYSVSISIAFIIGIHSFELPDMNDFRPTNSNLISSSEVWNPFIQKLYEETPKLRDREALLCSFSVTCSHCNEFAKRINAQLEAERDIKKAFPPIVFMFYSDDIDHTAFQLEIDAFMSRNLPEHTSKIKTLILNRSEMMNLTGTQFPVFTLIRDNKVTKMMLSNQFNYYERDSFFYDIK